MEDELLRTSGSEDFAFIRLQLYRIVTLPSGWLCPQKVSEFLPKVNLNSVEAEE